MENEEHEGITLTVDPTGWPDGLEGIIINSQTCMIENGVVKILCEPVWTIEFPNE